MVVVPDLVLAWCLRDGGALVADDGPALPVGQNCHISKSDLRAQVDSHPRGWGV